MRLAMRRNLGDLDASCASTNGGAKKTNTARTKLERMTSLASEKPDEA